LADSATDEARGPEPAAIEVVGLRKTYRTPFRRKRVEALRGVTFTVERGHIFGFVGPNGAGKTTIAGLLALAAVLFHRRDFA
jgi:ABC-type multidrug transport system ATPase subunit